MPITCAAAAADLIVDAAAAAIERAGRFTLVLSGGRTPEKTYELLAAAPRTSAVDWSKVYLFFGDERFVPSGDARSNYALARRSLFSASIPANHILAIPTNLPTPAAGAALYARLLASFFGLPPDGPPPAFDLILLGLGDDGHTASLFPGAAALDEERAWVTASPPGTLPPLVDRITLTYPVLNAAKQVAFLVSGAGKAEAARDVLMRHAPRSERPAAGVKPTHGTVTWLFEPRCG